MPEPSLANATVLDVPDLRTADPAELTALLAQGFLSSVWLTGQVPSRDQRRGRYTPESMTHPGKMLPTIARYAIRTYTNPGEVVLDPMAGIGTTLVEAMRLGRRGVGVEYEREWVAKAADNIRRSELAGAPGRSEIYAGDSTLLPSLLPASLRGHVALVITSPPYGPSTHGHVRTPGPRRGKVRKIHHKYGSAANLAYRSHHELADGFAEILAGCRTLLRPGGHVVVTARPYRRHGELVDIPGMVEAAGTNAGLDLVEECIALICGVRKGVIIPRASFFQQKNIRNAIATGDPQWLVQHEDVLLFKAPPSFRQPAPTGPDGGVTGAPDPEPASDAYGRPQATRQHSAQRPRPAIVQADHGLDVSSPSRMDRRPQPAHPAITHPCGRAADPRAHPAREPERTPDPCPPHPRPMPASIPSDATGHRRPADRDTSHPQPGSSSTAGRR